jgi:hypothetical protein
MLALALLQWTRRHTTMIKDTAITTLNSRDRGDLIDVVHVAIGMHCMIIENVCQATAVENGAQDTIVCVVFEEDNAAHSKASSNVCYHSQSIGFFPTLFIIAQWIFTIS